MPTVGIEEVVIYTGSNSTHNYPTDIASYFILILNFFEGGDRGFKVGILY